MDYIDFYNPEISLLPNMAKNFANEKTIDPMAAWTSADAVSRARDYIDEVAVRTPTLRRSTKVSVA